MMHRTLISILFLVLFIGPFFIVKGCLNYEKYALRKEFKQRMKKHEDPSSFVTLGFSLAASKLLAWEHEKEFEYQGVMYDVVSADTANGFVNYRCWKDTEESHLNQKLTELTSRCWEKRTTERDQQQHLFQFYQTLFCSSPSCYMFESLIIIKHISTPYQSSFYISVIRELDHPPRLS